jgi:hypothetical protein
VPNKFPGVGGESLLRCNQAVSFFDCEVSNGGVTPTEFVWTFLASDFLMFDLNPKFFPKGLELGKDSRPIREESLKDLLLEIHSNISISIYFLDE